MIFSCKSPAKTFVLGEYSVTADGKAMVLLSEPCFKFSFYRGDNNITSPPIAKFISRHQELRGIACDFFDPYYGIGGLGASSAEFLAWVKCYYHISGMSFDIYNEDHYKFALEEFICCSSKPLGLKPSGADMIAQNASGLVWVDLRRGLLEKVRWPFSDLALCLVHSGNKMATHEHLENLSDDCDFSSIGDNLLNFKSAISNASKTDVINSINKASRDLDALGFLAPYSKTIIDKVMRHDFCFAAKGCGAMGSDVILIVFCPRRLLDLKDFILKEGLSFIGVFKGG